MHRTTLRLSLTARALLTAACTAALAAPLAARAVEPGQTAPTFTLPKVGGGQVALADFKGQVVYLDFWASWCGPCRQSFPWMNDLGARLGPKGLKIVAVNVDAKAADAERFLAQVPARFTVALDAKGETPGRYGIQGMPTSMLIGPDGKVLLVHAGFRPDERQALEARIEAALAQAAPGRVAEAK